MISFGSNSQHITIESIKLELGSVSTLANDLPMDYTTELLRCQRYFYTNMPNSNAFTSPRDFLAYAAHGLSGTTFPVEMAAIPTVTLMDYGGRIGKVFWKDDASQFYDASALDVTKKGFGYLYNASNPFTAGRVYATNIIAVVAGLGG